MRCFLFIFFLLLGFGCVRNDRIPKGIISPKEMHSIMWDLMRADAYASNFIMPDSTRDMKAESAILYEKIFAVHSTTQDVFKKSMAFYESRPDLFKIITDSLRSDEKRVQSYEEYKRPQQQKDTSTRKIKLDKKLLNKK